MKEALQALNGNAAAATLGDGKTAEQAHRAKFFRQSGWMMFATVASGVMMFGVHPLSKKIPTAEYGTLVTLLTVTMIIPSIPLQMVLAQQTAAALATGRQRQLAGMIRMVWLGTFALWLLAAAVVLWWQKDILARWDIANPAALWVTVLVVLGCLWMPMFFGLLQGAQNFHWLGWATIFNGASRVLTAAFIVLVLGGSAAGILTGAALAFAITIGVCIWQSRQLWLGPSAPFDWRTLLGQVIPLMVGFGAYQFLLSADTAFVKAYFGSEQTAFYGAAGTLSRALVWLVGPLAMVMFPKIVHSAARAEKTDLLGVTLLGTAVLVGGAALGLWLLGPLMVKIVYPAAYVNQTMKVLPWYAGAMVPLSLANVLVNNLLARSQFRVVPGLLVLAVGYAYALTHFHGSPVAVLQTLTIFCVLVLLLCAWFTWAKKLRFG